jgi:hypothetical protein
MRVSAQRGQYVISRQAPGDRFALVFTGDPRHPRGPYPHAMSLSRAESPGGTERAREASADTSDTDAVPTDAEIVAALRRKAEKGDAAAARELREWRAVESTAMQGDGWLALLTGQERRIVRRIIDRALARDGSPQPEG